MNILCKFFGHKISGLYGEFGYIRYFRVGRGAALDGIKTLHIELEVECDRCGNYFRVGNIHANENRQI